MQNQAVRSTGCARRGSSPALSRESSAEELVLRRGHMPDSGQESSDSDRKEERAQRRQQKKGKVWRPKKHTGEAAMLDSVNKMHSEVKGYADAFMELKEEKKERTDAEEPSPLSQELQPVALFQESSWKHWAMQRVLPVATALCWQSGWKKTATVLSSVSLLATALDYTARWSIKSRAESTVVRNITEQDMLNRVATSGMMKWVPPSISVTSLATYVQPISLLSTLADIPFGYVVPIAKCSTTNADVRLLSNKNTKLDKDKRTLYEVAVDRVGSTTTAYVSPDVISQLGVKAEHLDDAALEASYVSICGAVGGVNVHTSMSWNIYQDSAMVGALMIRHNKRIRRKFFSSPKNESWVTPLTWLATGIALATSPFLIRVFLHQQFPSYFTTPLQIGAG